MRRAFPISKDDPPLISPIAFSKVVVFSGGEQNVEVLGHHNVTVNEVVPLVPIFK